MTREELIKSEYREYQHRTTGIDIWEEGAFRAGFEAALKLSLPPAEGAVRHLTDDEIEKHGMEGGLRDGELQMYWEGATWYRSYAQKIADKMAEEQGEMKYWDEFNKQYQGNCIGKTLTQILEAFWYYCNGQKTKTKKLMS